MTPEGLELLLSMATALAAGLVVGAEREQGRNVTFGGVRTFPLCALAGAIGMLMGTAAFVVIGVAVGALLAVAYVKDSEPEHLGMSTEVAAVVTFGLGALCTAHELPLSTTDRLLLVAAGATATLGLLSLKKPLHRLIKRVSEDDVYATAKLLLLSVIVLPLLPDERVGPWGALNPRSLGLLVILISGIGFAGYVAIRAFGPHKGLGLTGILGGLASSTAVTLTFAGRARATPSLVTGCAVAIVLASATMFPRVLVEVAAVSPELAMASLWPFATAGLVALAAGGVLYLKSTGPSRESVPSGLGEYELENPFSLSSAFKFALLFTVVLIASRGAAELLADTGVYIAAVVAGLADADAIALSVARLYDHGDVSREVAVRAVLLASGVNTLSKIGLAFILGGTRLGVRVGVGLSIALAAGAVVLAAGT